MSGRLGPPGSPRPGSWVKIPHVPCKINRKTYPHATYGFEGSKLSWTHNGCACNQVLALTHRHQVATPPITFNRMFSSVVFEPSSLGELIGRNGCVIKFLNTLYNVKIDNDIATMEGPEEKLVDMVAMASLFGPIQVINNFKHTYFPEDELMKIFSELVVKPCQLTPLSRRAVVASYQGAWRSKYQKAWETFLEFGLRRQDAIISMFVKDDLEMGVPSKAPRAIQFRKPVFALEQGRFTKAIEKWFYSLKDEFGTIIVAKADGFTVASNLIKKSSCFSNPVYLMLDASKFDAHVSKEWLRLCLKIYKSLMPVKYHRKMQLLWSQTFNNRGFTKRGVQYLTSGTRMSGDMDTSLGNSIIMYLMLTFYLKRHNIKHSLMVNGDDSLVVINMSDLSKAQDISLFKQLGFNMKFEYTRDIHKAEFCQSRLIFTDYGPTMARNPARIMGRTSWSTQNFSRQRGIDYIHTLGLCERAASWGVPVASSMATKMIEYTKNGKKLSLGPWMDEWFQIVNKPWRTGEPIISLETRISFEKAWDMTPAEQIACENSCVVNRVRTRFIPHETEYEEVITWGLEQPKAC